MHVLLAYFFLFTAEINCIFFLHREKYIVYSCYWWRQQHRSNDSEGGINVHWALRDVLSVWRSSRTLKKNIFPFSEFSPLLLSASEVEQMSTSIPPLRIVYWTLLFNEPWNNGMVVQVERKQVRYTNTLLLKIQATISQLIADVPKACYPMILETMDGVWLQGRRATLRRQRLSYSTQETTTIAIYQRGHLCSHGYYWLWSHRCIRRLEATLERWRHLITWPHIISKVDFWNPTFHLISWIPFIPASPTMMTFCSWKWQRRPFCGLHPTVKRGAAGITTSKNSQNTFQWIAMDRVSTPRSSPKIKTDCSWWKNTNSI